MDPKGLTLWTVGGAGVVGVVLLGSILGYSMLSYDGPSGPMAFGSTEVPAAEAVFNKGLEASSAPYKTEPVAMDMRVLGPKDETLMSMAAQLRPDRDECFVEVMVDARAAVEAYGGTWDPGAVQEEGEEESSFDFGVPETFDEAFSGESFTMGFGYADGISVIAMGDEYYGMRDVVPGEASMCGVDGDDDEEDEADRWIDDSYDMWAMIREFTKDPNAVETAKVSIGKWHGTTAYVVETAFEENGGAGVAKFYFRAEDVAPLHVDMELTGGETDKATLAMIRASNPGFDPTQAKSYATIDFRYGDSVSVTLPTSYTKIPTDPDIEEVVTAERYDGQIAFDHDAEVPLDSLQIHVVVRNEEFEVQEVLGRFNAEELSGSDAGFQFVYKDTDEDGLLSGGDAIVVMAQGLTSFGFDEATGLETTVVIYDEWAGAYAGSPGPAFLPVLLGIVLAAFAARRRLTADR